MIIRVAVIYEQSQESKTSRTTVRSFLTCSIKNCKVSTCSRFTQTQSPTFILLLGSEQNNKCNLQQTAIIKYERKLIRFPVRANAVR